MTERRPLNVVTPRRIRLSDSVCAQIIERISSGTLAPGSSLPSEIELARTFEVSKSVVREALGRLATIDAVDIRQGKPTTEGPSLLKTSIAVLR